MAKKWLILFMGILFLPLLSSCSHPETLSFQTYDYAMGTLVTQMIYHKEAEDISGAVNDRIADIEAKMTINKPGGEINALNDAAGEEYIKLDCETIYVLESAKYFSEISSGAFDITVGPLVKLWGIWTDNPQVPNKNEINDLLDKINYKDILIEQNPPRAMLKRKGQAVDLGGIAKGYAADEAIKIYREKGVESALISLGGNIAVLGGKPDKTPWKIGIRNPKGEAGSHIGVISIKDASVVSSGGYERFFEQGDFIYHHILDPKTGYPAETDLISVTIVADVSMNADALSTAVFILGFERGRALVEGIEGVESIFITKDNNIYITSGLKGNFEFKGENEGYLYVEEG